MTNAHAPGPLDLVALVSFDGEVYENQAVVRERLGGPNPAPHAVGAAIEQWLGRRRHMWIDVRGRQIHGIATARPLASSEAWEIDTLVDAGSEDGAVVGALLRQVAEAAAEAGVERVLLRLPSDAPAVQDAMRAGFMLATRECLWGCERFEASPADPPDGVAVRPAEEADAFALFQLYNRALPMDARSALGVTLEEWSAAQDRRWLGRGGVEYVAERDGRVRAAVAVGGASDSAQLSLLAEPDAVAEVQALLGVAANHLDGRERVLVLLSEGSGGCAPLLRDCGLNPGPEYVLLVQRTARPALEALPAVAGQAVPTGG